MFIIFNKDGSIFAKTQSDYVMQGSNRVNKVYIGFVDNNYESLSCNAVFNLPNQTRWTIPAVSVANGFEYLGQTYYGWVISLTDDVTKYSGQVEMTIQVVNATSEVLFTYLANITVNRTGFPLDSYWDNSITVAQFNDYMAQLAVKLQANTVSVVVSENDLQDVGEKNVLYFIIGQESDTPYQVKMWNGSEYTLLGTINLSSFASKEEFKQLQNEVVNPFVVVETVQDLPSTNQDKLYVVIATGKWYYWNGTQYAEGGDFISTGGGSDTSDAINIRYDNTYSGLSADNVQDAIDELDYYQKNNYDDLTEQIVDLKNALYGSILAVEPQTYDNVGVAVMDRANGYPIVDNQKSQVLSIKGKSLVVNQLFMPSNTRTIAGVQITKNDDNSISLIGTANALQYPVLNVETNFNIISGRIYAVLGAKTDIPLIINNEGNFTTDTIFTATKSGSRVQTVLNNGTTYNITTKIKIIDLTKAFGAGNEPTTIEEFNRLTMGFDFDTYNLGSVESTNISKITIGGFNKFDGELEQGGLNQGIATSGTSFVRSKNFIQVIGGETYTFVESETSNKWKNRYVAMYDKNYNWIRDIGFGNSVNGYGEYYTHALDSNCSYIKLFYYADQSITPNDFSDICFHLTGNGALNGVYKPYKEPIEVEIEPVELNGIGTAQDEKTETQYKKVIGSVDMGTLSWGYNDEVGHERFSVNISSIAKLPLSNGSKANILCAKYKTTTASSLYSEGSSVKQIALYTNASLTISDSDYTNAATFKQSLNGIMLYYETITPIITDEGFGEVLFKVQRGGTMESDSNGDITALQVVYKPIQ